MPYSSKECPTVLKENFGVKLLVPQAEAEDISSLCNRTGMFHQHFYLEVRR